MSYMKQRLVLSTSKHVLMCVCVYKMVMNKTGSLGILRLNYRNMPHIQTHDGENSWKSGNFSFVMDLGLCS